MNDLNERIGRALVERLGGSILSPKSRKDGAIRRIRERCEREGDEWFDDPVFPGEDDR